MAFDGHAKLRIVFEEVGGLAQSNLRIGTNFGGVVIEIGVANFLEKEFVEGSGWRCFHVGGRVDGDAYSGVGAAVGSAGGEGVGRGSGRSDGGVALRSNCSDFRSDGNVLRVCGGPGETRGFAGINGGLVGGDGSGGFSSWWRRRSRDRRWESWFLVATCDRQKNSRRHN